MQEPHSLFFFFQCCCCPLRPPGHCSISDSAFVLSLFIDPLPRSHSMIFGPIFLSLLQSPCLDLLLEPMNPVPSLQNQSLSLEPHFCIPTPELTRGRYREVTRGAICNQGGAGGKRTSAHRHKSYDDKEEAKWEKRQRVTSKQQKRGRGEKTKSSSSILDHFSSSLAPCFGSTQQQLFCS